MAFFNTQNKVNLGLAGVALVMALGASVSIGAFASTTVKLEVGKSRTIKGFTVTCQISDTKIAVNGVTYKCV